MSIEIGNRIRQAREAARLSQAQLAKLVGISQTTIQKIETGETEISKFVAVIWAALRLPLSELNPIFSQQLGTQPIEPLQIFAAAQDTAIRAQNIALSRMLSGNGILMTVLRGDGSSVQIFLETQLAEALARELSKTLAAMDPRALS